MSRIKIIVNPLSGKGHGGRIVPHIREAFRRLGADFDLVQTTEPGEAIRLAEDAVADGFDTVVAVGGDGTSHEVINGMMSHANGQVTGTLGCIPSGSGNDFAIMSGAPVDIEEACAQIVRGKTRHVDIGQVTIDGTLTRYFDNAVGIGFDAWVTRGTYRVRYVRGMALYLSVVLKTIFSTMYPMRMTITADGATEERTAVMAVACNGPREGGSFLVAPDARMDDGQLDLVLAQWMPRLEMLAMVPRFMKGTHVSDPRVRITRHREITVRSPDPLVLHLDGEIVCDTAHEVHIKMLHRSLRIIAPEGSNNGQGPG